jgi:aldose 1-epimerase
MASQATPSVGVTFESWRGYDAVKLFTNKYDAILLPGMGANLVRLYDHEGHLDILRTPLLEEMENFHLRPQVYGIPILFLPNRIQDGAFHFDGREYRLEVNEAASHSHIHGFAHNRPWRVTRAEASRDRAMVEVLLAWDRRTDCYSQFPHAFELRMTYTLSPQGLEQEIRVQNLSGQAMPLALGHHTALRVPFCEKGNPAEYRLRVALGERWELNDVFMTTGQLLPLTEEDRAFTAAGFAPLSKPFAAHYTAKPMALAGRPFQGAVLEDLQTGAQVFYETGPAYGHWVIWNEYADKGFICPEPQTWAINGANLKDRRDDTGFIGLAPGEVWAERVRIYTSQKTTSKKTH